ncbi:hypothetical protein [Aquimarina addita]|uniref:hypothetical protein n=1 Tax=Aquimarina addita TaxID=870485 RepID=UPI0031F01AB7
MSIENEGFVGFKDAKVAVEVAAKTTLIETFKLVNKWGFQNIPQFKKARQVQSDLVKGDYVYFFMYLQK